MTSTGMFTVQKTISGLTIEFSHAEVNPIVHAKMRVELASTLAETMIPGKDYIVRVSKIVETPWRDPTAYLSHERPGVEFVVQGLLLLRYPEDTEIGDFVAWEAVKGVDAEWAGGIVRVHSGSRTPLEFHQRTLVSPLWESPEKVWQRTL